PSRIWRAVWPLGRCQQFAGSHVRSWSVAISNLRPCRNKRSMFDHRYDDPEQRISHWERWFDRPATSGHANSASTILAGPVAEWDFEPCGRRLEGCRLRLPAGINRQHRFYDSTEFR